MELLTLAIAGLTAIVVAAVLARRTGIATTLVLLVVGIVFSILPGTPDFVLEPDWILFGMITWLSVTLVVVSALAVGAVVHLLVPSVSFAAGVALGAVVSPTDSSAEGRRGGDAGLGWTTWHPSPSSSSTTARRSPRSDSVPTR